LEPVIGVLEPLSRVFGVEAAARREPKVFAWAMLRQHEVGETPNLENATLLIDPVNQPRRTKECRFWISRFWVKPHRIGRSRRNHRL